MTTIKQLLLKLPVLLIQAKHEHAKAEGSERILAHAKVSMLRGDIHALQHVNGLLDGGLYEEDQTCQ